MASCILALDQGTTSSRAIVLDQGGSILAMAGKELEQFFPRPGWVEHDAGEIWKSQLAVARQALRRAGVAAADVAGIGITNQRETTVVWDRRTGIPIHHAIVWQDRRTADVCDRLRRGRMADVIRERTGLVIDSYFSATKLAWILNHVPGARQLARRGDLAAGTIDSWLLWKLTGGTSAAQAVHATDVSNASRTMLCNIHTGEWDPELLRALKIPAAVLPRICSSSEIAGYSSPRIFGRPIPVAGIAGDQQAALFGQMCTRAGMVKNTYGTGCFLLMNTGTRPRMSAHGLLTTVAWRIGRETHYAVEGSVFMGGATVQWLRDGLKLIRTAAEVEQLAGSVADNGGVFLVPAFAGLGAPHWDPRARGILAGLTRGTTGAHVARAALESIAFQVADVLDVMREDTGLKINSLRVDGGAAANDLLLQFQADLLGIPIARSAVPESTALGAAFLAGLAVGFWKSAEEIELHWKAERTFEPKLPRSRVEELRAGWLKALERSRDWAD